MHVSRVPEARVVWHLRRVDGAHETAAAFVERHVLDGALRVAPEGHSVVAIAATRIAARRVHARGVTLTS